MNDELLAWLRQVQEERDAAQVALQRGDQGPMARWAVRYGYVLVEKVEELTKELAQAQEQASRYEALYRLWQFTARQSVDLPDEDVALRLWSENARLRRVLERVNHAWESLLPYPEPLESGDEFHRRNREFYELGREIAAALADASENPYLVLAEAARKLAVTLHQHSEQPDEHCETCDICCEVSDLLYDLGRALAAVGIDDLVRIPDIRDLAQR